MNKSAIIALILLGLYAASVFTYAILQSVRSTSVQLPENNIINYRFNPSIQSQLIKSGITVMTFEYSSDCDSCFDQKNFLEGMATNYKEVLYTDPDVYNLYLEEILNETFSTSNLTISSIYGNRTFANPTENETFIALCDLMAKPPITCVTE